MSFDMRHFADEDAHFDELLSDVKNLLDDPRERFDEYDDPFYEDPPNCYGTVASFDCQFTRCRVRSTCYIAYTNREASRRAWL